MDTSLEADKKAIAAGAAEGLIIDAAAYRIGKLAGIARREACLEFLRAYIKRHGLMQLWRDGAIGVDSEEERRDSARRRATEAKNVFVQRMRRFNGDPGYLCWALRHAIDPVGGGSPAFGKDFSRRPNRSMA